MMRNWQTIHENEEMHTLDVRELLLAKKSPREYSGL